VKNTKARLPLWLVGVYSLYPALLCIVTKPICTFCYSGWKRRWVCIDNFISQSHSIVARWGFTESWRPVYFTWTFSFIFFRGRFFHSFVALKQTCSKLYPSCGFTTPPRKQLLCQKLLISWKFLPKQAYTEVALSTLVTLFLLWSRTLNWFV